MLLNTRYSPYLLTESWTPPRKQRPMASSAPHHSGTRQRSAIACRYCRRRKIRCHGYDADPNDSRCSNCIRFNQTCVFTPVSAAAPEEFAPASRSSVPSSQLRPQQQQPQQTMYNTSMLQHQSIPGTSSTLLPASLYTQPAAPHARSPAVERAAVSPSSAYSGAPLPAVQPPVHPSVDMPYHPSSSDPVNFRHHSAPTNARHMSSPELLQSSYYGASRYAAPSQRQYDGRLSVSSHSSEQVSPQYSIYGAQAASQSYFSPHPSTPAYSQYYYMQSPEMQQQQQQHSVQPVQFSSVLQHQPQQSQQRPAVLPVAASQAQQLSASSTSSPHRITISNLLDPSGDTPAPPSNYPHQRR
ncbi:uncharacterized protein V1518DRAFT_420590 [Limtongia smithiae]|uniref:uncharacterized protein n=1 Tax=Limtongia smithiae TaxID=1125753 RepID=UPI0034CDE8BA